jgi:serine/threonine-protein kinase
VIHRDVKPENLFLVQAADGSEAVKLIDFGYAWMPTDADERAFAFPRRGIGTPGYIAPEQRRGEPPTPGADVFALGVVLYEMLGASIHPSGVHRPEGLPGLSTELTSTLERCLAVELSHRMSCMADLAHALRGTPEFEGASPKLKAGKL